MCPKCKAAAQSGHKPAPCCLPKTGKGVIATALPHQDIELFDTGLSGEEAPTTYSEVTNLDALPYMSGAIMRDAPQLDLDTLNVEEGVGGYISPKSVKLLSDAKLRAIANDPFRRKALKEAAMEELDKRAERQTAEQEAMEKAKAGLTTPGYPAAVSPAYATPAPGYGYPSPAPAPAYGYPMHVGTMRIPYEFDENLSVGTLGGPASLPSQSAFKHPRAIYLGEASSYRNYEFDNADMAGTIGGPASLPRQSAFNHPKAIYLGEASTYRNHEFDNDEMVGAVFAGLEKITPQSVVRHAVASLKLWAKSNRIEIDPAGANLEGVVGNKHGVRFRLTNLADYNAIRTVALATISHWDARGINVGLNYSPLQGEFTSGSYDFIFFTATTSKDIAAGFGPGVGVLSPWKLENMSNSLVQWAAKNKIGVDRSTVRANRMFLGARSATTGAYGSHYYLPNSTLRDSLMGRANVLTTFSPGKKIKFKLTASPGLGKDWYLGYFTDDHDLEIIGTLWLPIDGRDATVTLSGSLVETLKESPAEKAARIRLSIERLTNRIQHLYGKLDQIDAEASSAQLVNRELNNPGTTATQIASAGFAYPGVGGFSPGVGGFAYPGVGGFAYPGVGSFEESGELSPAMLADESGAVTRNPLTGQYIVPPSLSTNIATLQAQRLREARVRAQQAQMIRQNRVRYLQQQQGGMYGAAPQNYATLPGTTVVDPSMMTQPVPSAPSQVVYITQPPVTDPLLYTTPIVDPLLNPYVDVPMPSFYNPYAAPVFAAGLMNEHPLAASE